MGQIIAWHQLTFQSNQAYVYSISVDRGIHFSAVTFFSPTTTVSYYTVSEPLRKPNSDFRPNVVDYNLRAVFTISLASAPLWSCRFIFDIEVTNL